MFAHVLIAVLLASFFGCRGASLGSDAKPSQPDMTNPASMKCVADGYRLEPTYDNGVPTANWCVDTKTGSRCEEWEYFRGTCSLP